MAVTIVKRPDPTTPVLFPHVYDVPVCWTCYRRRNALAMTVDPRISATGRLVRVCVDCAETLFSGRPVARPARTELPELLTAWARWTINAEVDDETLVGRMLASWLPGLPEVDRGLHFGDLMGALLWQQAVTTPGFDLSKVPPGKRDIDRLERDAKADVVRLLDALMGGAR